MSAVFRMRPKGQALVSKALPNRLHMWPGHRRLFDRERGRLRGSGIRAADWFLGFGPSRGPVGRFSRWPLAKDHSETLGYPRGRRVVFLEKRGQVNSN